MVCSVYKVGCVRFLHQPNADISVHAVLADVTVHSWNATEKGCRPGQLIGNHQTGSVLVNSLHAVN